MMDSIRIFQEVIEIYDLKEQIKILKQSENIQKKYLELTLRKAKAGNVSPYELSQAQADYFSYTPRILNVRLKVHQLEIDLKKNLGRFAQMTPKMRNQSIPNL